MKVNIDITTEDGISGNFESHFKGTVQFDSFGVVMKVDVDDYGFKGKKNGIRNARSVLRSVAERVRAEVLNKMNKE